MYYMKYFFVCNSYLKTGGGSPFIPFSLKYQIKNPCQIGLLCHLYCRKIFVTIVLHERLPRLKSSFCSLPSKLALRLQNLTFWANTICICLSDFAKCTFFFLVYWVIVAYTWLVKLPKFPRRDEVSWVLFLMSIDCKNEIFACDQLVCSCVLASVQASVQHFKCSNIPYTLSDISCFSQKLKFV